MPNPQFLLPLYLQPRIIAVLFLGFASGLPLALTASTLGVWLMEAGVDKTSIGLFAAVATPYAFKFLWSPLIDSLPIPLLSRLLGRRRGWLIATQIALIVSLIGLGSADPAHAPWITALCALCVAIASASQDIVIDAYRIELLTPEQQGAGAAVSVLGYRIGMIAASAGALYLAQYTGWFFTYACMAALVAVGMLTALLTGEPSSPEFSDRKILGRSSSAASAAQNNHIAPMALKLDSPRIAFGNSGNDELKTFKAWFAHAVIAPFADMMKREGWWLILLFILFYKLGDAFMGVMTNPFLIEIGFTKVQIATIVKLYGIGATIAGAFIGGAMVNRIGMIKTLFLCGFVHALTNLMFVYQAQVGADEHILILGITLENLSGGMGTAAFVAFISGLCNTRFTATQYALLSSLAAVGRTWLSTPAGFVSKVLGWEGFFILSTLLALPGLILLWWLNKGSKLRIN